MQCACKGGGKWVCGWFGLWLGGGGGSRDTTPEEPAPSRSRDPAIPARDELNGQAQVVGGFVYTFGKLISGRRFTLQRAVQVCACVCMCVHVCACVCMRAHGAAWGACGRIFGEGRYSATLRVVGDYVGLEVFRLCGPMMLLVVMGGVYVWRWYA